MTCGALPSTATRTYRLIDEGKLATRNRRYAPDRWPHFRETANHPGSRPVGKALSSEYCRAYELARLLDLGPVESTPHIMNMCVAEHVGGREVVIRRAQRVLSEPPPAGTNVIIVGHGNLMQAATGAYAGEGGSAIYAPQPESGQGSELVARLSPDDWTQLANRFAGD